MKKTALFLLLSVFTLVSCGNSNIDLVKNGFMRFNKTISVGNALDNWKSCEKSFWREFKTDNGIVVVEFSCHHKIKDYFSKMRRLLAENKNKKSIKNIDLISVIEIFQFTVNQDGTVQIDNEQLEYSHEDGTGYTLFVSPVDALNVAYGNYIRYRPESITAETCEVLRSDNEKRKARWSAK